MNRRNFLQAAAAMALPNPVEPEVVFGTAKQWCPGSVIVYGWNPGIGWRVVSMRHEAPWIDRGPHTFEHSVQQLPAE